jgi:hypothetical protein
MKKFVFALLASVLTFSSLAATPADVTAPIHQFIDGFHTGDVKSAYAALASGDIVIMDEFAPHLRFGYDAPEEWAAAYEKHAAATQVTDGFVKYGPPTRIEIEGNVAYVIIPTVYTYKQNGRPLVEEGQMTFVLHSGASAWRITALTWTGVKPHPSK